MNKYQIRAQVLEEVFRNTLYNEAKREVFIFCPNQCHVIKRKLQINVEKNTGRCWVCNLSGKIFFFLKKYSTKEQAQKYYNTLDFVPIENESIKLDIKLPEEYKFLLDYPNNPIAKYFLTWLKNINISKNTILKYKLGFADKGNYYNRIIFPSFDESGKLNYFSTRSWDDNSSKKYLDAPISKKQIIYNELFIDWNKPIIIVENIKTCLVHNFIPNIIPILGSGLLNEHHKLFSNIIINEVPIVYIALDQEAKKKSLLNLEKIQKFGIDVRFVSLDKQPDEMSTNNFLNAILNAKRFSSEELLYEKIMEL